MTAKPEFRPGHPEWCSVGAEDEPNAHCGHWYDCEPCCRCGDDTPDPNCDCDRCTYVRQAEQGYPHGHLRKDSDISAPWPSGMCGKRQMCEGCPSQFLCFMKARGEYAAIQERDA